MDFQTTLHFYRDYGCIRCFDNLLLLLSVTLLHLNRATMIVLFYCLFTHIIMFLMYAFFFLHMLIPYVNNYENTNEKSQVCNNGHETIPQDLFRSNKTLEVHINPNLRLIYFMHRITCKVFFNPYY